MNQNHAKSLLLRAADGLRAAFRDNPEHRDPSYPGLWAGLCIAARVLDDHPIAVETLERLASGDAALVGMKEKAAAWIAANRGEDS